MLRVTRFLFDPKSIKLFNNNASFFSKHAMETLKVYTQEQLKTLLTPNETKFADDLEYRGVEETLSYRKP